MAQISFQSHVSSTGLQSITPVPLVNRMCELRQLKMTNEAMNHNSKSLVYHPLQFTVVKENKKAT